MNKLIFITWEKHQRTRSICNKLAIPLFELTSDKKGIWRYIELIPKTINVIKTQRPKILLTQNPSIILTVVAVFLKFFFKYILIVDAHNEAVEPFIHNNFFIRYLSKKIISLSDQTIVTNDVLSEKIIRLGGTPIVLPDFLPNLESRSSIAPPQEGTPWEITLICTYADDEPYEEVFAAIRQLGDITVLNVTGKVPQKLNIAAIPNNIKLLGFVPEHDYWETLFKSHIIIDLTTMDNCLVCGAYESLAIEKPTLLSTSQASKQLFGFYAHHVRNTAEDIKAGLEHLMNNYGGLKSTIHQAKLEFIRQEDLRIKEFLKIVDSLG